jgi:hypothetical protein
MPKYIIEREIPGVESLSERDTKAAALNSNRALKELGTDIQWQHSYISKNKTHCVYIASDEDIIHKHAEKIGTPIISITEVTTVWDPTTAYT